MKKEIKKYTLQELKKFFKNENIILVDKNEPIVIDRDKIEINLIDWEYVKDEIK